MREKSVYVFGSQIELPMLIHVSRVCSHVASRVTWHSHDGFELLFLLEGATTYEFAGQKAWSCTAGISWWSRRAWFIAASMTCVRPPPFAVWP